MPNIVFNVDLMYRVFLDDVHTVRLPIIKELVLKQLQREIPGFYLLQVQDLGTVEVEVITEGLGTTAILENFISRLKEINKKT